MIGIAGSLGEGFQQVHDCGIDAVFSLVSGPMSLEDAMADTRVLVEHATEEILRAMLAGRRT